MKYTQYDLPQKDEDRIVQSIIDEMHQLYIELCNKVTIMDSDYVYECKVRLHHLFADLNIDTHINGLVKLCSIKQHDYLNQKCVSVLNKNRSFVYRMRANKAENIAIVDALQTMYEFLPEYLPNYDEWVFSSRSESEGGYAA